MGAKLEFLQNFGLILGPSGGHFSNMLGCFLMTFFDMLLESIFVHFWIDFEIDFGAFFEHF